MPSDFDLANFAVKIAGRECSYTEARIEDVVSNEFMVKNGTLDASNISHSHGICVRVLYKGSQGSAFTNKLDKKYLRELVKAAIKDAKRSQKVTKEPIEFTSEKPNKSNYVVKQRRDLRNVSPEEKIKELMSLDKAVAATGLKTPARFFTLDDEVRTKYYVNSEGAKIKSEIPRTHLYYMLTASKENDSVQRMYEFGSTSGWEVWGKWKLWQKIPEELKLLYKILEKAKRPPTGNVDIVLSPEIVGIASHESVGHPYEADRIWGREAAQAGESFISKESLGTRIGSDVVTVVDDPRLPGSFGHYVFDDEGVKARRRFLIKNGIVNELLHNRWSATKFDTHSNGAARANDWDAEPIIRMANTFMLPGDRSDDEIIRSVKNGVYVKSYMEWNIDDKRYNQKYTGLEAYKIKNGSVEGMIRNPILEFTTPTFWSAISAASKRVEYATGNCGKGEPMQGIPVFFGGPTVLLKGLRLGSK